MEKKNPRWRQAYALTYHFEFRCFSTGLSETCRNRDISIGDNCVTIVLTLDLWKRLYSRLLCGQRQKKKQ